MEEAPDYLEDAKGVGAIKLGDLRIDDDVDDDDDEDEEEEGKRKVSREQEGGKDPLHG